MQPSNQSPKKELAPYEPPRIVHQGQLKQFAGSPLGKTKGVNPLGLPQ